MLDFFPNLFNKSGKNPNGASRFKRWFRGNNYLAYKKGHIAGYKGDGSFLF
jgi:hypothetical protein